MFVLLIFHVTVILGQRKCPIESIRNNEDVFCCRTENSDLPGIIYATIDEDVVLVTDYMTFFVETGRDRPDQNDLSSAFLPFQTNVPGLGIANPMFYQIGLEPDFTSGAGANLCDQNSDWCANKLFQPVHSDYPRVWTTKDIELFEMGGPYFSFILSCTYKGGSTQRYEVQLSVKEKDGVSHSSPEINQTVFPTNVIISEGLSTPPNNIILSRNQLVINSKDSLELNNVIFSISTEPRNLCSSPDACSFEVSGLQRDVTKVDYDPSEFKETLSAELRVLKPIYFESLVSNLKGKIDICMTVKSYISSSNATKQNRKCFHLTLIDEDTMPPLFCPIANLQQSLQCFPPVQTIHIRRQDIAIGFQLFMDPILAFDGDFGRDQTNVALDYKIVSQTPGKNSFSLNKKNKIEVASASIPTESIVVVAVTQADNPNRYSTKTFQIQLVIDLEDNFAINGIMPTEVSIVGQVSDDSGDASRMRIKQSAELDSLLETFTSTEFIWKTNSTNIVIDNGGYIFYTAKNTDNRTEEIEFTCHLIGDNTVIASRYMTQNIQLQVSHMNSTVTTATTTTTTTTSTGENVMGPLIICLLVALCVCVFLLLVITIVYFYQRRKRSAIRTLSHEEFVSDTEKIVITDAVSENFETTKSVIDVERDVLSGPLLYDEELNNLKESNYIIGPVLKSGNTVSTRLANYTNTISNDDDYKFVAQKIHIDAISAAEQRHIYDKLLLEKGIHGLKHINILYYEGSFVQGSSIYVIHEYAKKGSLRDVFDTYKDTHWDRLKTVSSAQLLQIMAGVASGLDFLHKNSIVHGALTSKNVMLDSNFRPKIRNYENNKSEKNYNSENVRWWALELFDLEQPFTKESDIWSLGVVMWEVMTFGTIPYQMMEIKDIKHHLTMDRLPMAPSTSPDIYAIMTASWNTIPSSRPTASQIIEKLNVVLKGNGISNAKDATWEKFFHSRSTVSPSPVTTPTTSGDDL